jgi:Fanconi anemia group M protein
MNDINQEFFNHPLLKNDLIQFRSYQYNISRKACHKNTLVVLPTALGKTIIALMLAVDILKKAPDSKILLLAPTRPLVLQHYESFKKFVAPTVRCCLFSSNLSPIQRTLSLNEHQIFFSTPQIIQNDLIENRYTLSGFGTVIFDEAHKARKNYAYTYVAQQYHLQCQHPIVLGLTASPGKDQESINLLCEKLQIEQIIFRDFESTDVKDYIYDIDSIMTRVELPPEIIQAQALLDTAIRKTKDFLIDQSILPPKNYISKMDFIRLMQDLKVLENSASEFSEPDGLNNLMVLNFPHLRELLSGKNSKNLHSAILSKAITGIYLTHLQEILTTQDIRMFRSYLSKLQDRAQMGNDLVNQLLRSKYLTEINFVLDKINSSPKIPVLLELLTEELQDKPNAKIIIFSQFREMASYIVHEIENYAKIAKIPLRAKRFVGQACRPDDKGLNQKEQAEMICEFSNGDFNVLVATSVAEEGLDIPSVDAVIFYEAIPSEIRLIQRRGRTGRHEIGRCYLLVTPQTLDQTYHHVSHRKEEKMHQLLKNPDAITTVPSIARSNSLPQYAPRSLENITEHFQHEKEYKEERKKLVVAEQISSHEIKKVQMKNYAPRRAAAFDLVTDMTQQLGMNSITVKKASFQQKNPSNPQKIPQTIIKKTYNWLLLTMEHYRDPNSHLLQCSLSKIEAAANEEQQDWKKIRFEIDKCINENLFVLKNSILTLVD